jgi:hypothetical protein
MAERGLIFTRESVRAILGDKKSQTRRLIKPDWWRCLDPDDANDRAQALTMCPYGVPGDRIWVKETWAPMIDTRTLRVEGVERTDTIRYRADGEERGTGFVWRTPLFLPRWASRILLEVTGVRVERLQNISERGARAEGFRPTESQYGIETCAVEEFARGWDSINEKRAPWASNPWVWVIGFKRAAAQMAVANG